MSNKIKVFFLIEDLRGGGAQRVVIELLRIIDPTKFSSTLILHKHEGPYVKDIPKYVQVKVLPKPPGISNIFKRTFSLAKFLNAEKPDIIIGNLTETNIYLLQSKPFVKHKTRFIITEHNNLSRNLNTLYTPFHRFYKRIQIKTTYVLADKIIAVSKGVKADLVNNHGLAKGKVVAIENPVNIDYVQAQAMKPVTLPCEFDSKKKLIVTVGRLVPQKGYFDMLEAFKIISDKVPSQLIILGEGPLREQLETRIKHLSLAKKVCLAGFLDNPWAFIKKADLYLSTSYWEGFSVSFIEAMACATPLALTDCDFGPRELIEHGVNGYLLPVGQVEKIADEVVALLDDNQRRKQLGDEGFKSVQKFDSKMVIDRYAKVFAELLEMNTGKEKV